MYIITSVSCNCLWAEICFSGVILLWQIKIYLDSKWVSDCLQDLQFFMIHLFYQSWLFKLSILCFSGVILLWQIKIYLDSKWVSDCLQDLQFFMIHLFYQSWLFKLSILI